MTFSRNEKEYSLLRAFACGGRSHTCRLSGVFSEVHAPGKNRFEFFSPCEAKNQREAPLNAPKESCKTRLHTLCMGVVPMRRRLFRPKQRFRYRVGPPAAARRIGGGLTFLALFTGLCLFLSGASMFLKNISCRIAVSDACDIVTGQVNAVIAQIMAEGEFEEGSFVTLEKNDAGEVCAVSSNMARINALSAEILERVVGAAESRTLDVRVPLGNLSGISLLMGRGPGVPVEIIMLTSSRVAFQNKVVTAGINQTKHQINLEVIVDIDILIPWGTESAQVVTEVMIADTLVIGKVPQTYLNTK